jgi:hypothetical protein
VCVGGGVQECVGSEGEDKPPRELCVATDNPSHGGIELQTPGAS